jgi:uncharacterized protein (TIGR04255 family)
MNQSKFLSVPEVPSARFERNLIDVAVCELRFPTLLELESKPPLKLQSQLRKKYPFYEKQEQLNTSNLEGVPGRYRYLFRSKKSDWTITVHAGAVSLETNKYTEFEEFFGRLTELLGLAAPLIDSDFFTRVGLRYTNKIPIDDGELKGWINDELLSNLNSVPYGVVSKYFSEVRGYVENGAYTFRQVLSQREGQVDAYVLDYDYWKENVEVKDALDLVKIFNKTNFSFFSWCLGPKAQKYLGKGRKKTAKH